MVRFFQDSPNPVYPSSHASHEFRDKTKKAMTTLIEQFKIAKAASDKDDLVDDNNDGIADVKQIDAKQVRGKVEIQVAPCMWIMTHSTWLCWCSYFLERWACSSRSQTLPRCKMVWKDFQLVGI
jgi:hypothetical protein